MVFTLTFLVLIIIESIIVWVKIGEIKEYHEIGRMIPHVNKITVFMERIYNNYKSFLFIPAILIMLANLIVALIVQITFNLIIKFL
jgi:hypothetical protein